MKDYAPQGTSDKFPPAKVLLSTLSNGVTMSAFFLLIEKRSERFRYLDRPVSTRIDIGPIVMTIDYDGKRDEGQPRHPYMLHCSGTSYNLQTNNRPFTHESSSIRLREIVSLISSSEKMVAKVIPSACVDYLGHAHLQCEESGRILGSARILFAYMLYDMIRSDIESKWFYLSNGRFDISVSECIDDRGTAFEISNNVSGKQVLYDVRHKDGYTAEYIIEVANCIYGFITGTEFWGI